jgi:hypothetical protein
VYDECAVYALRGMAFDGKFHGMKCPSQHYRDLEGEVLSWDSDSDFIRNISEKVGLGQDK